VRAAIADLNPANRVVGATAGSSRQKAVRSPPIIVPGGGKIETTCKEVREQKTLDAPPSQMHDRVLA
jgi:hypothetical protein